MRITFVTLLALVTALGGQAASTIDPANRYAYGANLGWLDGRGDTNNGAVIGEYVCSGYLYAANAGWINLGNGSPTNGIQYQNVSAADFGVNLDGAGNLRGYAYAANLGWINFEPTGAPKVDLLTGKLDGYVWSANCGWISLSNTVAYVQTDTIAPGTDSDHNGLPDAWERQNFGFIGVDPNADPDHDGVSSRQEYLAGTDPNNGLDYLHITRIQRGSASDTNYVTLLWSGVPSRFYAIQRRSTLDPATPWTETFTLPWPGVNNVGFDDTSGRSFYRIRSYRSLMP